MPLDCEKESTSFHPQSVINERLPATPHSKIRNTSISCRVAFFPFQLK